MCLIVYSPDGALMERNIFDYARGVNPDGIGVMSCLGVEKFVGRKAAKRAWRYLSQAVEGLPHAIHFRWATHGDVMRSLCHPFKTKDGAFVMHNGIITRTAAFAGKLTSDTSLYVAWYMKDLPEPCEDRYPQYLARLERDIGFSNKMVIYHALTDRWSVANEDMGFWKNGLWYSNEYSLPYTMRTGWDYSNYEWGGRALTKIPDSTHWERELKAANKSVSAIAHEKPDSKTDPVRAAVRKPSARIQ